MAKQRQKYPALQLRSDHSYHVAENRRESGDPLRQVVYIDTDYKCFKKSKKEKLILKLAKLEAKREDMKK